jgi:hypothetical protein
MWDDVETAECFENEVPHGYVSFLTITVSN